MFENIKFLKSVATKELSLLDKVFFSILPRTWVVEAVKSAQKKREKELRPITSTPLFKDK